MTETTSPPPASPLRLGAVAALLHAAFDLVTYASAWTRAPYLRVEDMDPAFAGLSPVGISIASSVISGLIAALLAAALDPGPPGGRRGRALGLAIAAFWISSAVLTHAVWLSTPWSRALVALPLGLPRGLAIGFVLARLRGAAPSPVRG